MRGKTKGCDVIIQSLRRVCKEHQNKIKRNKDMKTNSIKLNPKNCQIILDRMKKCYNLDAIKLN